MLDSSFNIVGATHAHYAWFTKTYGLYPSYDTLQVPTLLGVVASVCTQPKTQAMILGKSIYNYELALKSTDIQIINELKLLVGTIDNKLTFSSHIKLVLSKVNAKIAALRRIRNLLIMTPRLNFIRRISSPISTIVALSLLLIRPIR